jgi:hypothetical protein
VAAAATYQEALAHFYSCPAYRRIQFMRFVSKQKRDSNFMKKFESNFPNPAKTVIIWGAGFKQHRNYKGRQPTDTAEHFK